MLSGRQLDRMIGSIYQCRKLRVITPEGSFTGAGLWVPSERERGEDPGFGGVQAPLKSNRYSHREYCRTKKHVHWLVERWILGLSVPYDVSRVFTPEKNVIKPEMIPELVSEFVRYLEAKSVKRLDDDGPVRRLARAP